MEQSVPAWPPPDCGRLRIGLNKLLFSLGRYANANNHPTTAASSALRDSPGTLSSVRTRWGL